jgi:hypothetical protein
MARFMFLRSFLVRFMFLRSFLVRVGCPPVLPALRVAHCRARPSEASGKEGVVGGRRVWKPFEGSYVNRVVGVRRRLADWYQVRDYWQSSGQLQGFSPRPHFWSPQAVHTINPALGGLVQDVVSW